MVLFAILVWTACTPSRSHRPSSVDDTSLHEVVVDDTGRPTALPKTARWHNRARSLCPSEYDVYVLNQSTGALALSEDGQPRELSPYRVAGYVQCKPSSIRSPTPRSMPSAQVAAQEPVEVEVSILGWHCYSYPAYDGTPRTNCGESKAACIGLRLATVEGLRSRNESTLPTECILHSEAFCSVHCESETGICGRNCFANSGDCEYSRATFPELNQGVDSVASDRCSRTDVRAPPPGEGTGWWCNVPPLDDLEAIQICERTESQCRWILEHNLSSGTCRHHPSLACYSYVRRVSESLIWSCSTSFAACETSRKSYSSPDIVEVSPCITMY